MTGGPEHDQQRAEPEHPRGAEGAQAPARTEGQKEESVRPALRRDHVEDAGGYWQPEDGYDWVNPSGERDLRVKWKPGVASRRHPHVVASDEEGRWQPEAGYTWVDAETTGDYRVRHLSAFDEGLADRNEWERWIAGLAGDFQRGAYWWSGQRSLPNPGSCGSFAGTSSQFVAGCEAAKVRLTPTDMKRKSVAEYRRGWNSYTGSVWTPDTTSPDKTASAYEDGLADRTEWERWMAGLNGDFQKGAYWWSGQRSLPNPGSCSSFAAMSLQFVAGCEAAKNRLTPTDLKRKSMPEYKMGWNDYSGDVAEPPDAQAPPTGR